MIEKIKCPECGGTKHRLVCLIQPYTIMCLACKAEFGTVFDYLNVNERNLVNKIVDHTQEKAEPEPEPKPKKKKSSGYSLTIK